MAREWVIRAYDGFEGLELVECALEEPGPTDVRLRVEAFALNWGDEDLMNDRYSFSFSAFPASIGIEAAGIVDAVGKDVEGIEVGERYSTLPYFYDRRGASADTLLIDQAYVTKAPAGLTAVESASIWMQFMTAYFPVVELGGAAPGRNILVPAATSTAGNAALQIGRLCGATMIATTRSEANRRYLLDSGADHVFDRAIVSEMDHFGALTLNQPAHDVDRGVMAIEQAGCSDEAQRSLFAGARTGGQLLVGGRAHAGSGIWRSEPPILARACMHCLPA